MIEAHFTPEAVAARIVPIPGARNLRDMGGYPTEDGRRVKRGMLFRGGHPGDIPVDRLEDLRALGLRGHVDLRTTAERKAFAFPSGLVAAAGYWARDYDYSDGDTLSLMIDPATTAEDMRQRMIDSYRRFPEEQREGIAAAFRLLLEGHAPLLVNCTAGKDRAGVTSALLLSALGVPRAIVRRDYALTETLHDPRAQLFHIDPDGPYAALLGVKPEIWQAMMRSEPDYIDATFAALDRDHGGIAPYLAATFAIGEPEILRLRTLLLEH